MIDPETIYKSQVAHSHQAGLQAVFDAGEAYGRAAAIADAKAIQDAISTPSRRSGDEQQKKDVEQKHAESEKPEAEAPKGQPAR